MLLFAYVLCALQPPSKHILGVMEETMEGGMEAEMGTEIVEPFNIHLTVGMVGIENDPLTTPLTMVIDGNNLNHHTTHHTGDEPPMFETRGPCACSKLCRVVVRISVIILRDTLHWYLTICLMGVNILKKLHSWYSFFTTISHFLVTMM